MVRHNLDKSLWFEHSNGLEEERKDRKMRLVGSSWTGAKENGKRIRDLNVVQGEPPRNKIEGVKRIGQCSHLSF